MIRIVSNKDNYDINYRYAITYKYTTPCGTCSYKRIIGKYKTIRRMFQAWESMNLDKWGKEQPKKQFRFEHLYYKVK